MAAGGRKKSLAKPEVSTIQSYHWCWWVWAPLAGGDWGWHPEHPRTWVSWACSQWPPPSLPLLGLSAERRNQYLQSILSLRRDLEDEDVLAER